MPFETTCPHCGRVHDNMPDSATGAMVRCRACFKPFTALALAPNADEAEGEPVAEDDRGRHAPEAPTTGGAFELRAVIARLTDIQRKCGALVKRHPELAELEPTLDAVLRDLRVGQGPRGEALPLRELALPLGSWVRRLDRLGLPALGRELRHVERALIAADEARLGDAEPEAREDEQAPVAAIRTYSAARPGGDAPPPRDRRRPVALIVGGVVVLAAAALGSMMLLRRPARTPLATAVTPGPEVAPTRPIPTPRATATPSLDTFQPSDRELARLVDAASQAQLAAQRGDLARALDELEAAARIDLSRAEVRAAAQAVVDEMASRAARDEAQGRFGEAEEQLVEAQRLSERFVLDATALDARLRRLRRAERTVRIRADELDRLRGAIARKVEVRLVGREVREGILAAVEEGALVLEVHDKVGAGEVAYTVRIPLTTVELVVYRYRP